jgi:hypothetical protein
MKALYIGLGVIIGSLLGFLPINKEHQTKVEYYIPLQDSSSTMNIKYSPTIDEGDPGSWTHCGVCQQGVLTPNKDGILRCTYCGK